jgi:LEA14-like dessication related protein
MRQALSLIGLGLLLVLSACATAERTLAPRVRLADIALLEGGLLEQKMRVELDIGNPNNFDLPLEGLTFTLELNDRPLVEGYTSQAVVIPRLGEARLPVLASSSLLDLIRQIMTLGQGEALSYRLSGRAYLTGLGRLGIPFETGGTLELQLGPGRERSLVPL